MKTIAIAIILVIGQNAFACNHDTQCGFGFVCLNGNNGIGNGFCVKAENTKSWGHGQRNFTGCSSDFDCKGWGESCIKRTGQITGICVK